MYEEFLGFLTVLVLAFLQNTAFSIVSRSRNRNNMTYHLIASTFSNGLWFLTTKALVTKDMGWFLFIPYTFGTVSGSLCGVKISMLIEGWLKAESDSHLKPAVSVEDLQQRVVELEAKCQANHTPTPAALNG